VEKLAAVAARATGQNASIHEPAQTEETSMVWLSRTSKLRKICLVNLGLVFGGALVLSGLLLAQRPGQKTFPSPEDASQALFAAAEAGDQAVMLDIFGPGGNQIISSGECPG
jgi:DUF2950 family protein